MINVDFPAHDVEVFQHERFYHPHPRVQRRFEVLWLKSQQLDHGSVCRLAGVSPNTLRSYICAYIEGGVKKLKELNFYQPVSELEDHRSTIEDYFRKHPVATIKEAVAKIEQLTGIKRSPTQVRKYLKSIGVRLLKVGAIPSKADSDKQEAFKKEELEPRLQEAKDGTRAVLFGDAAHFVFAPFLGFLWCFTRLFVKSPSGRKRFNVLGALDAVSHKLISITTDTYINASSVCDLLLEIRREYVDIPVTLVLDNARYQKCAIVFALAEHLNIELLYLPAYSPNLNLIERLWKFVKKTCLYSKYYEDFSSFKGAISECLDKTHTKHKKDLDTLLSLRFQTFKENQFVTA